MRLANGTTITVMYPITQYIWGPDRVLVKIDALTDSSYYYLYNGHGDVVQIVDTAGNIVNSYDYDVWGNFLTKEETIENHFTYFGQTYDETTGLYYLRARYYDPTTGRFTQQDPAEDGYNWYVYGNQNPVMFVDPSGQVPVVVITIIAGAAIGAIVSGGVNIVAQSISKGWGNISWGEVGINTLGGAISGGLGGSGASLGWVVAGNAAISAGTYAGIQNVNNKDISLSELLVNAGFGAVFGLRGGSSSATIQNLTNTQTAYYMAKALGLQSGQEINKSALAEIATKAGGVAFLQGIRDEMIETLGTTLLEVGSTGDTVRYLQSILGVEQDGFFGNQTQNALKELQRKLGVEADGVYGNQTKNALYNIFE